MTMPIPHNLRNLGDHDWDAIRRKLDVSMFRDNPEPEPGFPDPDLWSRAVAEANKPDSEQDHNILREAAKLLDRHLMRQLWERIDEHVDRVARGEA